MMQIWENADKLTRDRVTDSHKDLLKIRKITPGRLEHVHKTVDIEILHPEKKALYCHINGSFVVIT